MGKDRFERFEVALVFLLQCNSYWTTLYRRHSCWQTRHGTLVLQCTLEVYPGPTTSTLLVLSVLYSNLTGVSNASTLLLISL